VIYLTIDLCFLQPTSQGREERMDTTTTRPKTNKRNFLRFDALDIFEKEVLPKIGSALEEGKAITQYVRNVIYPRIKDVESAMEFNEALSTLLVHIGHTIRGCRKFPDWEAEYIVDRIKKMARDMLLNHLLQNEENSFKRNKKTVQFNGLNRVPEEIGRYLKNYIDPDELRERLKRIGEKRILPKLMKKGTVSGINDAMRSVSTQMDIHLENYNGTYYLVGFMGSPAITIARLCRDRMIQDTYDSLLDHLLSPAPWSWKSLLGMRTSPVRADSQDD
jgi:hypothetical protein